MKILVCHTANTGNNCHLSQFITEPNYERAAEIGDIVCIGPSACIVERVRITTPPSAKAP
jgi:serine acetyltransferase